MSTRSKASHTTRHRLYCRSPGALRLNDEKLLAVFERIRIRCQRLHRAQKHVDIDDEQLRR
jgi:hypothetical protein